MRPGVWEIVLIILVLVILFGHKKIPGMMKNLADGVKVFKKEMKTESKSEPAEKSVAKKAAVKKKPAKKAPAKKPVKK